jgi:hypothetical protein
MVSVGLGIAIAFFGGVAVGETTLAPKGMGVSVRDPNNQRYYSSVHSLECGGKHIVASTHCVSVEEGPGVFCYTQDISFIDLSSKSSSTLKYDHPWRDGTQNSISDISCRSARSRKFVLVASTNFGNCRTCEWYDVYTPDGKYVGTNRDAAKDDLKRDNPSRLSAIEEALDRALFRGSNETDSDSVEISRVPIDFRK